MNRTLIQKKAYIATLKANVPGELRDLPNWVCYKLIPLSSGKTNKIPYSPHNISGAKSNDRNTWGTFEQARKVLISTEWLYGLGFMFAPPYVGIDFDNCIENGMLRDDVAQWVETIDSYTEISVSGKGLHIIVKAQLPVSGRKNGNIEIYSECRFFTMSGDVYKQDKQGTILHYDNIANRQSETLALLSALTENTSVSKTTVPEDSEPIPSDISTGNVPEFRNRMGYNDKGNAARIAKLYNGTLIHVEELGWLGWNGRHWEINRKFALRAALNVGDYVRRSATRAADAGVREEIYKWATVCGDAKRVHAMLEMAAAHADFDTSYQSLNKNSFLLNCENATVDLRNGYTSPHEPADLITYCNNIRYDPNAQCPNWENFLWGVFQGNLELITFIKKAIGYTLTGDTRHQVFFFCYGTGSNGKSTFADVLLKLCGDYGKRISAEKLMERRTNDGVEQTIAALSGKRMIFATEVGEGGKMAEALIKDLVGGDTIVGRHLYKGEFDVRPVCKLWMYGNHRPSIRGTDNGIWRRVIEIPFNASFGVTGSPAKDPNLPEKLSAEMLGILNWAIEGAMMVMQSGLEPYPSIVAEAIRQYREDQDVVGSFLKENCEIAPHFEVVFKDLFATYTQWCKEFNQYQYSANKFGRILMERGYTKRINGASNALLYTGLRMIQ